MQERLLGTHQKTQSSLLTTDRDAVLILAAVAFLLETVNIFFSISFVNIFSIIIDVAFGSCELVEKQILIEKSCST